MNAARDETGRLTSDLGELANSHWRAAYLALVAALRGRARQYGTVQAFLGGVPLPFANGCLVLQTTKPSDLRRAVSWLNRSGVPYQVRLDEGRAQRAIQECVALGLERAASRMPGMVLEVLPAPPEPPAGVTTERVDATTYPLFVEALIASGFPSEWAAASFPSSLVRNRNMALFIGKLDGATAAMSLALRTGDVTGVYAVGTAEHARRRGLGTAVTWACVGAAREWGSQAVVLQASEMGLPVYRAMGFREVVEYARFAPPPPSAAPEFEPAPEPQPEPAPEPPAA